MTTVVSQNPTPPLRLAVIGCGRMATELARRSVRLGRARITAIYDPDPETLAARAAEFDAAPITDLVRLAASDRVDAFLVASPGLYHHENVLAVAPAGKPIYSEKPLCTTVARCDEMIETCRRYGAKLFVGQVLRLFPLFWKSYEVIASGTLGFPRLIAMTRAGRGPRRQNEWRASREISGGTLLEVNSHELDYMLFLMGQAQSVYLQGHNLSGWGDFPDSLLLQITFANGGIGMLHSSNASPVGEYRVHIQCTEGNLLHGGFGGELRYQASDAERPTVITADDLAHYPDPYDRELLSFFDWAQHDMPPLFTGETGRANVVVAEAAYRSLESGKPEPVCGL